MKYKITKINDSNKRKEPFKDSRIKSKDLVDDISFDKLIQSEYEAISLYIDMIAKVDDESIKEVLKHILNEENEYIVELKKVITGQNTENNLEDSRVSYGKHTDKFARILKRKGINFTFTSDGEIKLNNKDDFEKVLALAEDYSFEFGGYDYDPKHFIIAMAE